MPGRRKRSRDFSQAVGLVMSAQTPLALQLRKYRCIAVSDATGEQTASLFDHFAARVDSVAAARCIRLLSGLSFATVGVMTVTSRPDPSAVSSLETADKLARAFCGKDRCHEKRRQQP